MRLVCGVGPLAMRPASRSPLIERDTKNAGGGEWAFISKGTLEVQEGGRGSSGGVYVLTMEYNGRPPIPARKNGRHTAKSERLHSTVTGTNFSQNLSQGKISLRICHRKYLLDQLQKRSSCQHSSLLLSYRRPAHWENLTKKN